MGLSNIERNHENGLILFELQTDGFKMAHLVPALKTRELAESLEGLVVGSKPGSPARAPGSIAFEIKFYDYTSSALAADAGNMSILSMTSDKGMANAYVMMDEWGPPSDGQARARLMQTHSAGVVGAVRATLSADRSHGPMAAVAVSEILCAYDELACQAGCPTEARADTAGYGIGQSGLPHAKAIYESMALDISSPAPKGPRKGASSI